MGRDDARPVAGLQGGTAPARAFSDFMKIAVARRPVENFQIEVPLPDWQLEPDEEVWGNLAEEAPLVDDDGNPIGDPLGAPADPLAPGAQPPEGGQVDQQWMDEVLGRPAPPQPQQPQPQPVPPRAPPPRSVTPADPLQPRPEPSQF